MSEDFYNCSVEQDIKKCEELKSLSIGEIMKIMQNNLGIILIPLM